MEAGGVCVRRVRVPAGSVQGDLCAEGINVVGLRGGGTTRAIHFCQGLERF